MLGRVEKISELRLAAFQYVVMAMFLVLLFGLWRLQVARSERYEALAESNRIREVPILAPRGRILDREGRRIVDNYPSFSALLVRDQDPPSDQDLEAIAAGLHLDLEDLRDRIQRTSGAHQILLKEDITPSELAFIEAHANELPQLETIMAHRRLYPKYGFAAHLIGYVGEVSDRMLEQPEYADYNPGDIVGKTGVERQYNHLLMGTNGYRRIVVNSRGKEVGRLGQIRARPGTDLRLTIDLDVQIAAERALEGHRGAIVALDPRTGEVLAMVSRPVFDPNDFAVRISRDKWNQLVNDEDHPLLNRAIQAQLAPGSVFKIIMAVAGLEEGIADNMHVTCGGGHVFYGRFFRCWIGSTPRRSHGVVGISTAITQSCDTFFYTLGERLGIARIARYATAFGLGRRTGIDLPQEASGTMPSEEWKQRVFQQKWYPGETISVAIGQGAITVTPLQLARAIGGIAMGGRLLRPHVAFPQDLPPGFRPAGERSQEELVNISKEHWEVITDAMAGVVNPGGTAASAHLEGIDFAGKTGTAQVVSTSARARLTHRKYEDNAWFVGVAPRRNPEIVVAVLVEQGEHGYLAGRLTAQVVKAFVEKQRNRGLKMAGEPSPPVEVGAVWNQEADDGETLAAGHFSVQPGEPAAPASSVPGRSDEAMIPEAAVPSSSNVAQAGAGARP